MTAATAAAAAAPTTRRIPGLARDARPCEVKAAARDALRAAR